MARRRRSRHESSIIDSFNGPRERGRLTCGRPILPFWQQRFLYREASSEAMANAAVQKHKKQDVSKLCFNKSVLRAIAPQWYTVEHPLNPVEASAKTFERLGWRDVWHQVGR